MSTPTARALALIGQLREALDQIPHVEPGDGKPVERALPLSFHFRRSLDEISGAVVKSRVATRDRDSV